MITTLKRNQKLRYVYSARRRWEDNIKKDFKGMEWEVFN
jgi:hypothetical protein